MIKAIVVSDKQETIMATSKVFAQLGIPTPIFVHYNLHVTKIFKGKEKINNVTSLKTNSNFKISVHTSQAGAQCGTHLTKGKKYLISGRIFNGQLQINHCDWVKDFGKLSRQVKHGIHGKYDCKCQVGTCIDGYCDIVNGCKWNVLWNQPADECTQNYRMCEQVDNTCQWSNENTEFENCNNIKLLNELP